MASTINSSTSNGIVITPDTSGEIELQANGVTKAKVTANGLQDNNGNSLRGGMYRNLIINGDMQIAQRGTSATGVTSAGYYTVDRFNFNNNSLGGWTLSQSTTVPTGQGFAKSFKVECTTADASPAASDFLFLMQKIEGQNLQYLKKGTSNAEQLTASFWVRSNKTGTYICELQDIDNSRTVSKSYTISSPDTWEKQTLTFPADTTGAFDNDNGNSLQLNLYLAVGSDRSSGTLATTWASTTSANRAVGQVNLADSTSNYINITGLQLEVGEGASNFEFLPYDVQLQRCQRYCQVLGGSQYELLMIGAASNSTVANATYKPPVNFRTIPSLSYSDIGDFQLYRFTGATTVTVSNASLITIISSSQYIYVDWTSSGLTQGEVTYLRSDNTTSTKLIFSAEL